MTAGNTLTTARWIELIGPWLQSELPGGPFTVRPIVAGHSNIVVAAHRPGGAYVIRRPPAGQLVKGAHDVLREARVLNTLAEVGARHVPRVVAVAEADSNLGPCYAMTRLPGEAVRHERPDWLSADQAGRASRDIVSQLAHLHSLPVEPFVAERLGRTEGYLARQLALWGSQRDERVASRKHDGRGARALPDEDAVRAWLLAHRPGTVRTTLVHGDYKLDNTLLDPTTGALTAVLDWELATVGDPLADLGFLLAFWPDRPADVVLPDLTGDVTAGEGFLRTAELAASYSSLTGADLMHLSWYRALALWKTAILLEASYGRWLDGDAEDGYFATLEKGVPALLRAALAATA